MSYLLDASVWLAASDQDDDFHQAAAWLIRSGTDIAALDLTVYEVGNVAVRRWLDADRARRLCLLVVTACDDRLVRVDQELSEQAVTIAASEELTVYDAAYVAAARRHSHALVSSDIKDLVRPGHAIAPDAVER